MILRTARSKWALLALAGLLLFGACGEEPIDAQGASSPPPEETPIDTESEEPREQGELTSPPPVTLRYFEESAELQPWTYCYLNGCADGAPPKNLVDVGSPDEVFVEYPLSDWTFTATFQPAGDKCGRYIEAPLEASEDGSFVLRPAGYADDYEVTLFGRGDGDLFVSFLWTTPSDGPLPTPKARLAVLADHDGAVDSYGVELEVTNLARTPSDASATITVQAADGESLSFDATQAKGRCWPEGTVYWDGPDDEGLAAANLGKGPFTYKVELVLDGERHVATATWPDEEIVGNEPSVALDFRPELPALN